MPDYRLTFNGDMVGRLSVPDALAQSIANAILSGCRFELSAGFEKSANSPQLAEFVISLTPLSRKPKNADPAAGSDGSHSDGNRVRASDPPTGDTRALYEAEELAESLQERIGRLLITDVGIEVMLAAASHFEMQQDCQMKAWSYVLRRIAHKHRDAKIADSLESDTVQFTHGDDITVRLTRWCEQPTKRTETQALMDQAAREIERMRLTDEELEAVHSAAHDAERACCVEPEKWITAIWRKRAATLRKLLARLA